MKNIGRYEYPFKKSKKTQQLNKWIKLSKTQTTERINKENSIQKDFRNENFMILDKKYRGKLHWQNTRNRIEKLGIDDMIE